MGCFGLELEGELPSGCSQDDILPATIVGGLSGCLFSLGHLIILRRPAEREPPDTVPIARST